MAEILEKGDVYFLYWPARGERDVHGLPGVQRFFLVLKPDGGDTWRRLIVGQKKLPAAEGAEGGEARHWGFVDRVAAGDVREALRREEAASLEGPPPQAAGEGAYAIARHGNHTDLVYVLDFPKDPGEPQHAFHIEKEATYVLSMKNPDAAAPQGMGLDAGRRPDLPNDLRARFEDRRWTSADPPAFLDHEGVEFLLVAGREDVPDDLESALRDHEEEGHEAVLAALREAGGERATRPLLRGSW